MFLLSMNYDVFVLMSLTQYYLNNISIKTIYIFYSSISIIIIQFTHIIYMPIIDGFQFKYLDYYQVL